MSAPPETVGSRRRLVAVVLGTVLLVSPALRDHDSFPLSTYPVYASARPREATFLTAYGEAADGSTRRLPMGVIARTDDPLIAAARLDDAVRAGRAQELCAEIATRASRELVAVVVVRERHDVVDGARADSSLVEREQIGRCVVPS